MSRFLPISLISLCLAGSSYAFDLDPKMYLSEHALSYTSSFDVSTQDRKLGTLYRRIFSFNTVYDFYDNQNHLISSANSHFFSYGAHLDVVDQNKKILGTVEEKLFTFFPSFDLYAPDGMRLGRAQMNFWGTSFTLYEGMSDDVLAEMSRPFFRFKSDWTINIKDIDRIQKRGIDSRLLMTVLAVQGDLEYIKRHEIQQELNKIQRRPIPQSRQLLSVNETPDLNASRHKIQSKIRDFIKNEESLNDTGLIDNQEANQLAVQLDKDYQAQYAGIIMTQEENMLQFTDYCLNYAKSADVNSETKKAIVRLLQTRLKR